MQPTPIMLAGGIGIRVGANICLLLHQINLQISKKNRTFAPKFRVLSIILEMKSMSKILVTGAAGCIGAKLAYGRWKINGD